MHTSWVDDTIGPPRVCSLALSCFTWFQEEEASPPKQRELGLVGFVEQGAGAFLFVQGQERPGYRQAPT